MKVPVSVVVFCSVLLLTIIFFHSQLIYIRVEGSFPVPITLPYTQALFIPWGSSQEPEEKMFLVKMILYQRECVVYVVSVQ